MSDLTKNLEFLMEEIRAALGRPAGEWADGMSSATWYRNALSYQEALRNLECRLGVSTKDVLKELESAANNVEVARIAVLEDAARGDIP